MLAKSLKTTGAIGSGFCPASFDAGLSDCDVRGVLGLGGWGWVGMGRSFICLCVTKTACRRMPLAGHKRDVSRRKRHGQVEIVLKLWHRLRSKEAATVGMCFFLWANGG